MRELDRCIKCGSCMRACPVVREVGEGIFPGPRSLAVDEARYASEQSSDELLKCSMCLSCRETCPSRIDVPKALLALRERNRRDVRPGHLRMLANIDAYGYSVRPQGAGIPILKGNSSDTCLFPGCIATWRSPNIAISASNLLEGFGSSISVPEGLCCCGSPLEKIGDRERLEKLTQRNKEILDRYDSVVTTCPGCAGQLNERYGIEALHLVEHIYEVIGLGKVTRSLEGRGTKVAVHMPCHLGRGVGQHAVEYLHQILLAVPGLKVVDYPFESDCCGAGGGLLSGFPEISASLASRKSERLSRTGADIAVTACPFCVVNLSAHGCIEVVDLATLLVRFVHR